MCGGEQTEPGTGGGWIIDGITLIGILLVSQTMTLATYRHELRTQADLILVNNPALGHSWQTNGELVFPPKGPDGFEVRLKPDSHGVIVLTDVGFHEHFEGSPEQAVESALGLVRDLLSPDMRVREQRANGSGYRWILERRDGQDWKSESRTGLLLWNYLGRRGERIYQNRHLPGRLGGTQKAG